MSSTIIFNCNRSLLDICLIGTNLRKFLRIGEKYQGFVRLVLKKKNVKGISLRLENHGNLHKTVPILIFYKIVFRSSNIVSQNINCEDERRTYYSINI